MVVAVLEAASSQLIALLSRVVVGELFLLSAGNFEVIPNTQFYYFFNSVNYPVTPV